jgi:hypothetical protein
MKKRDNRKLAGWLAVGLSTVITSFWAFWGIIENFHEGWYYASLLSNLGLMFVQYLSPMLLFMAAALVAVHWRRVGAGLHLLIALLAAWFFHAFTNTIVLFILLPLVGIGALYWFGQPEPRRLAVWVAAGLPLLTLVLSGIGPVLRVSRRLDDGNLQARLVQGRGVALVWAPAGPGWPDAGTNWTAAQDACLHLSQDGTALSPDLVNIWRLPSVDEAVRSASRHGVNSGGVWDAETASAIYTTTPDKESPLWQVHSQVIYWWTATQVDAEHAYMISYDGTVWTRPKSYGAAYLGFRCVKAP